MEKRRCWWAEKAPKIYQDYHDTEWGVSSYDDIYLFEMLLLESFQAGISFIIILKKRENFRKAFDNFDYRKIAKYDEEKVNELVKNEGIVRSKSKISATINNAKIFMDIQKEFGSFSNYLWKFTDNKIVSIENDFVPAKTELSDRLSKDLKKRGMKYVGSVTMYAYLQAVGIVNNHESYCFKYKK